MVFCNGTTLYYHSVWISWQKMLLLIDLILQIPFCLETRKKLSWCATLSEHRCKTSMISSKIQNVDWPSKIYFFTMCIYCSKEWYKKKQLKLQICGEILYLLLCVKIDQLIKGDTFQKKVEETVFYYLVIVYKGRKKWEAADLIRAIQVSLVACIDIGGRTLGPWVANPDTKLPTKLSCAPELVWTTKLCLPVQEPWWNKGVALQ